MRRNEVHSRERERERERERLEYLNSKRLRHKTQKVLRNTDEKRDAR
jgi:hypothetical protein